MADKRGVYAEADSQRPTGGLFLKRLLRVLVVDHDAAGVVDVLESRGRIECELARTYVDARRRIFSRRFDAFLLSPGFGGAGELVAMARGMSTGPVIGLVHSDEGAAFGRLIELAPDGYIPAETANPGLFWFVIHSAGRIWESRRNTGVEELRRSDLDERLPVGVLRVSPTGRITQANYQAALTLGFVEVEELDGAHLADLLVDQRDLVLNPTAVWGDKPIVVSCRGLGGDPVALRLAPLKLTNGEIVEYQGIVAAPPPRDEPRNEPPAPPPQHAVAVGSDAVQRLTHRQRSVSEVNQGAASSGSSPDRHEEMLRVAWITSLARQAVTSRAAAEFSQAAAEAIRKELGAASVEVLRLDDKTTPTIVASCQTSDPERSTATSNGDDDLGPKGGYSSLVRHGSTSGAISVFFPDPRQFSPLTVEITEAVADLIAAVAAHTPTHRVAHAAEIIEKPPTW